MTSSLLAHQIALEQRAFWRNPQGALFNFGLPLSLLFGLGATTNDDVRMLVPGILAFGILVGGYSNLAATVASLRADGVLKRIRATPLSSSTYLSGHVGSAIVTTGLISLATVAAGYFVFGAAPQAERLFSFVVAFLLGVTCFASLALAMTAIIPTADSSGPITLGTYMPLALLSGVFNADQSLPQWLDATLSWLPVQALVDSLRHAYDQHGPGVQPRDLAVLRGMGNHRGDRRPSDLPLAAMTTSLGTSDRSESDPVPSPTPTR